MAGPVTHIILALAALSFLPDKDHNAFIAGTSFPDIRYLRVISREKTHPVGVTWQDVYNEPSSFKAGMLFHALVDERREQYFDAQNREKVGTESPYQSVALKFLEDKLLYKFIENYNTTWPEVTSCFNTLYPEEYEFNIKKRYLYLWHKLIIFYCCHPRTFRFISRALGSVPFWRSIPLYEINHRIHQLEKNTMLESTIFNFYNNFLRVLEKEAHVIPAVTSPELSLNPR